MGVDPFKATETSETEKETGGDIPVKEKLTFTAPERKSRLGLDVRAMEKRESAKSQGEFKVPKKPAVSVSASMDEDDRSGVSGIDDGGDNSRPDHSSRRYRDKSSRSETPQESTVTTEKAAASDS